MEQPLSKQQQSQPKNDDLIFIDRKKFGQLIKKFYQAQYSVILLSTIAHTQNLKFTMTPRDVSDVLNIDWRIFERKLVQLAPKSTSAGKHRVYSLVDMVKVAELSTRSKRLKAWGITRGK